MCGFAGAAVAGRAPAGSRNVTLALISGFRSVSFSMIVTFVSTVAFVRSAVGMICRSVALYLRSGNASTDTSAGWLSVRRATLASDTSTSISSVARSASATIAPDDVEMFTPGGMGATLSPTSAIFLTTVPANGARITVFWSCASARLTSAFDCDWLAVARSRSALACASAASDMRTLLFAASRVSIGTSLSVLSLVFTLSCRCASARSASARWMAASADTSAASACCSDARARADWAS